MKKLVSLIIALAMLCLMVPAMAEETLPTGEWYLISVSAEGTQVDPAVFGMEMTLTLNEDGTCTMVSEETEEGTWTFEGNTLTITDANSETVLTYEEGLLKLDVSDGYMIFSQEKATPVELPNVVPAESEDAFLGNWVMTIAVVGDMAIPAEATDMAVTMTVEPGKVTMVNGEDTVNAETAFEEGALSFTDEESGTFVKLELNDDGSISYTVEVDAETAMTFYFVKADAE